MGRLGTGLALVRGPRSFCRFLGSPNYNGGAFPGGKNFLKAVLRTGFGLFLLCGWWTQTAQVVGQPAVPQPPGANNAEPAQPGPNAEVLTRGPIHEAFAIPVNTGRKTGLVVPRKPPNLIEEIPPAVKPEVEVVWIPGYFSWDDDRKTESGQPGGLPEIALSSPQPREVRRVITPAGTSVGPASISSGGVKRPVPAFREPAPVTTFHAPAPPPSRGSDRKDRGEK